MSKQKRTIAIDFDGVLHRYQGYQNGYVDGPIKGARDACLRLLSKGHTVVVFTTRPTAIVQPWLEQHGFPPLPITHEKKPFWCIIDDRAVHFSGVWDDAFIESVESFKPYWIGGNPAQAEQ